MPLKQYALKVKIAAARLLSNHPDMSVGEVASSVGINNPYYFSRVFSEKMGVLASNTVRTEKKILDLIIKKHKYVMPHFILK